MKAEIGSRLKEIRVEKGLTQKELASRVRGGIDYTYIGKIERGEQLPSLKILMKISDALSVPLIRFFQDDASATISETSPELKNFAKNEKGREFLRTLRLLPQDDVPLVTEIIKILSRHRRTDKSFYEPSNDLFLKAAEEEATYQNQKPKRKRGQ